MVHRTHELYEIERNDDIRALAPHLTYGGLLRWFDQLKQFDYHYPSQRGVTGASGAVYDATLRHSYIKRAVHLALSPVNQPNITATLRARTALRRGEASREIITENGVPKDFYPRLLTDGRLLWQQRQVDTLDLIAYGGQAGRTFNPVLATAQLEGLVSVGKAEALLFDVASTLTAAASAE